VEHAKKGKPFDASGPYVRNQGKDFGDNINRGGSDDEENEQKRA
jgi:hypothetical protein